MNCKIEQELVSISGEIDEINKIKAELCDVETRLKPYEYGPKFYTQQPVLAIPTETDNCDYNALARNTAQALVSLQMQVLNMIPIHAETTRSLLKIIQQMHSRLGRRYDDLCQRQSAAWDREYQDSLEKQKREEAKKQQNEANIMSAVL